MNIDTCLMLRRWNGERPQISLCTTISLLWSRPAGVVGQVLSAFSDSTVEWRVPTWRVALSYGVGTEEVADTAGTPRAMWMGGALFTQLHLVGPWSLVIRPESYWALEWGVSEVPNSKGPGSGPSFGECVSMSK
jgi:hypothetical protein